MKYNQHTKLWESQYWHPAITTDAVVFGFDGKQLNVLLIERGGEPYSGKWVLPGGFLREDDETAFHGVCRELKEETNADIFMEEFGTYSNKGRDPRERVITIAFFQLVVKDKYDISGGDDAKQAKWFPVDSLPELAFDHNQIVADALENLRQQIHFKPIGFQLLDKTFTMPQLQSIYEAILGKELDRRNFRKKMLALGYIIDTKKKETGNAYRSPSIYMFDEDAYQNAKKIGMRLEF